MMTWKEGDDTPDEQAFETMKTAVDAGSNLSVAHLAGSRLDRSGPDPDSSVPAPAGTRGPSSESTD